MNYFEITGLVLLTLVGVLLATTRTVSGAFLANLSHTTGLQQSSVSQVDRSADDDSKNCLEESVILDDSPPESDAYSPENRQDTI
jgi:hypothetical protein